MANIPISALPSLGLTSFTPSDLYVTVNSGVTYNTTLFDLQTYVLSGISTSFTGNTSATCINDLYVDNLHGCNDLTIVDDTVFLSDITANTITINNGQKVRGNTSTAALDFNDSYGINDNTFSLTSDNGVYAGGSVWLFGGEKYYIEMAHQLLDGSEAIGFGVYASGQTFPFSSTGKEVTVHDNKYDNVVSGNYNKRAVFVGTKNSTINSGLTNTVVIGGNNIVANTNDTVYVPNLNIGTIGSNPSVINLGLDSNGFVVTGSTSGGSFTGGTVSGETIFTGGLSATTFSATTIGASGNCVNDLYVLNIRSCSPLNINPNDEGNVYFGSTSAVTIDLSNNFVGIGISSPTASLHVNNSGKSGSTVIFEDSTNPDSTPFVIDNTGKVGIGLLSPTEKLDVVGYIKTNSGVIVDGGNNNGVRFNGSGFSRLAIDPTINYKLDGYFSGGFKFWNNSYNFFNYDESGLNGDTFQIANGFIKGKYSGLSNPDIYFGINVPGTPTSTLDVSGKTKTINFQMTSGATNGYVLTSDVSGNATWTAPSGLSTKAGTISGSSFTGAVLTYDVTFTSPYSNTNYSISITGGDARTFTYELKTTTGFRINTNSATSLTGDVDWMTIAHGES